MSDNGFMDKDAYVKQLEEENAALKKRVETLEKRIDELERLLGVNSRNSSKPPSSDPPGMSVILPKRRRKKRGARKGHQPHLRELLPQEFVKKHFHLKPKACTCGSTNLEGKRSPNFGEQRQTLAKCCFCPIKILWTKTHI